MKFFYIKYFENGVRHDNSGTEVEQETIHALSIGTIIFDLV